jgi:hypothetical protein
VNPILLGIIVSHTPTVYPSVNQFGSSPKEKMKKEKEKKK